jgi:hypothetical protein
MYRNRSSAILSEKHKPGRKTGDNLTGRTKNGQTLSITNDEHQAFAKMGAPTENKMVASGIGSSSSIAR